jgi:hypothetical protein
VRLRRERSELDRKAWSKFRGSRVIRDPAVRDDLEILAWAGTEFQNYDDSTRPAKKAAHGLQRIATPYARAALN